MRNIINKLQTDIRISNQNVLEAQELIDKSFDLMLDNLIDTEEYRKAKVQYDIKNQEKWWYYGRIHGIETALKYIKEKDEEDIHFAKYCEEVGAEELPF